MILLIDVGGVEVTSSMAIYWHYQVSYGKVALFLTLTHIYTKVFFFRFPQPGFIGVDVFSVLYPQMPRHLQGWQNVIAAESFVSRIL